MTNPDIVRCLDAQERLLTAIPAVLIPPETEGASGFDDLMEVLGDPTAIGNATQLAAAAFRRDAGGWRPVRTIPGAGGAPAGKVDDPTDVTNFRKTSCSPAQPKDGYVCEFSVTLNGIGRPKMKTRFFKGPDGKLAIDD